MSWIICLALAAAVLSGTAVKAHLLKRSQYNQRRIITPFNLIFCGVFISGAILFLPVYAEVFSGEPFCLIKTILLSLHNTIRLFIVDGEYTALTEYIKPQAEWIYTAYSLSTALLFVIAPVMTFGVVLSFFRNISSYMRLVLKRSRSLYVFSELNERSLVLAASIRKNHRSALIAFTDVFENNNEQSYELTERAHELDAILFKKDIRVVNYSFHNSKKDLFFFAIGEDETENIEQSLRIIELYKNIENSHLYVFSSRTDCELLLTAVDKGKMKVRRINPIRSLINRILYENGSAIFENAASSCDDIKEISIVIAGLGSYGTDMLRALSWFCQMDGYRLTINAFDKDPLAYEKLWIQCPELLSDDYNGVYSKGEAYYKINIHSGVDTGTKTFADKLASIENVSYVLTALGSDNENITAAVNLRMMFERIGSKPVIQAIVHNSYEKKALTGITNFRGQPYDIDFIGDLESSFTEEVIIDSELEEIALERHLKWGDEEDFWNYDYNYRSSTASAIHLKARELCGIPGAGKAESELTEEELLAIESLEHRRWNAYMRSEGYIYSGSPDKSSRNDLGKLHHDLVCYEKLSEEEKRKDRRVGTL